MLTKILEYVWGIVAYTIGVYKLSNYILIERKYLFPELDMSKCTSLTCPMTRALNVVKWLSLWHLLREMVAG